MPRIKIKDLPKNQKISEKELNQIRGGLLSTKYTLYSPVLQSTTLGGAVAPAPVWNEWSKESGGISRLPSKG
jgi:hypothetical protein